MVVGTNPPLSCAGMKYSIISFKRDNRIGQYNREIEANFTLQLKTEDNMYEQLVNVINLLNEYVVNNQSTNTYHVGDILQHINT